MRADVHMHTAFSHDSKAAPEAMARAALEKGLEVLCFTDHYDKDYRGWGKESIFDAEEYFRTLTPLREKYRGRIDIRIGVELGLQPHLGEFYKSFIKENPFDFVIGSVHALEGADPAAGYVSFDGGDEAFYRKAFQETLKNIQKISDFDVLGHLDYVVRYGQEKEKNYSYERYKEEIDEILRELISRGKGLELNMAGIKYGLPFAHPHPQVLKRYRELGGEIITVGADAHRPEHIAYRYHLADGILKESGFTYYTEFAERRPIFRRLS